MSKIRSVIVSGFFWTILNQLSSTLATLVVSAVLSRLITPGEYGIVGMVTLATGFLNVIKDFGFGAALVQKKEVSQDEYSTVFWVNIMVGAVLMTLVFFAAPWIASFFDEPRVTLVARVMSGSFLINSVGIVWNNQLVKQVAFKQIFYRNLFSVVFAGIVAIGVALKGWGIWALMLQTYIALIVNTYLNYRQTRWLPAFVCKRVYLYDLLKFSLPLLGDHSLNYWVRNVDNLLVGKFLGKTQLAYYSKAYTLMLLPVRQLSGTLTKVLFPSFSLIQDDRDKIGSIYLKISRVIAFVSFPVMIALSLLAEPVILIMYGDQWRPVIPLFQVLSWLGMFQALATVGGNVYLSQGKTALLFKIGLFSKTTLIVGIVAGLYFYGLQGMVWGYCLASAIAFLPELYFTGRIINVTLGKIILNFTPSLLMALAAAGASWGVRQAIQLSLYPAFIVGGIIFFATYLALNLFLKPAAWVDLLQFVQHYKRKKK